MESEIQVLKEMVKAGKIQLKTKDTDLQRLNIKIKRLEKTAEIRENIISQTLNTKIGIKDGIPSYASNAVSPRPFKSVNKKDNITPAPFQDMKDSPFEGKPPLQKKGLRTNSVAAMESSNSKESISLPPIASTKPPVPDSTADKKLYKSRAQELKDQIKQSIGSPYDVEKAADIIHRNRSVH